MLDSLPSKRVLPGQYNSREGANFVTRSSVSGLYELKISIHENKIHETADVDPPEARVY